MTNTRIGKLINHYQQHDLLRQQQIIDGDSVINFCSNDYLQLTSHHAVKKALIDGIHLYGLGGGASPAVCGYTKAHAQLEAAFAEFLQRERAILFNSGYHANLAVLATFANRHSSIIADKYCHASIIDGAILARANLRRYSHQSLLHAETLLKQRLSSTIVITESVFSMQGNITDVRSLTQLSAKYKAQLIIDDAHGLGVLGKNGRGIIEHADLQAQEIDCLISPLGKALGSMGAIVSGNNETIDALIQFARPYRYSTALPPAVCVGSLAALKLLQHENWRREKLHHLSQFFNQEAKKRQLTLVAADITPIKSILIGANKLTVTLQQKLLAAGLFVSCIRPPTVPKQTARLRISLNCAHSEDEIILLLDKLTDYYAQLHR